MGKPDKLGDNTNTPGAQEYSSFVSRDGQYFFFMSSRTPDGQALRSVTYTLEGLTRIFNQPENGNSDIYWMGADFIEELRPNGF